MFFELTDSQPVMDTFSIISIKESWNTEIVNGVRKVHYNNSYISSLMPDSGIIFKLTPDEFDMHVVIPNL